MTIALATVRLAASLAFCSVRIAAIIIGCINCAVLAENVVLALLHRYCISRLGEHMGLLVEPRTQWRDVGGLISTSAVLCSLAKTHLLPSLPTGKTQEAVSPSDITPFRKTVNLISNVTYFQLHNCTTDASFEVLALDGSFHKEQAVGYTSATIVLTNQATNKT